MRKAKAAFASIPKTQDLSVSTALALFDLKILPIVSYGIQFTWDTLTEGQLSSLDKLKANYLKRTLGVHRTSKNRLVYQLCNTELLCDQLKKRSNLQETRAYVEHRRKSEEKMADIDPDFYRTPAMTTERWKDAHQRNRHRLTRGAVHGFHHAICRARDSQGGTELCICTLCGEECKFYHIYDCKYRNNFDWAENNA